jgi:hypothetical protein
MSVMAFWSSCGFPTNPRQPGDVSPADYANAVERLHAGMRKLYVRPPHLEARSRLVSDLADQVLNAVDLNAVDEPPAWATKPNAYGSAELIADIEVWRAVTQVGKDRWPIVARVPQLRAFCFRVVAYSVRSHRGLERRHRRCRGWQSARPLSARRCRRSWMKPTHPRQAPS